MDLYQKGDFVGEYLDVWCVPAAIQTSINIMSAGADTSKAYQAKLFNLAYSLAPGNTGGADMSAWPMTLSQLGYGKYKLDTRRTIAAAVTALPPVELLPADPPATTPTACSAATCSCPDCGRPTSTSTTPTRTPGSPRW